MSPLAVAAVATPASGDNCSRPGDGADASGSSRRCGLSYGGTTLHPSLCPVLTDCFFRHHTPRG